MILQSELIRLRKAVNSCDMLNEHVSSKAIGWHLDHSLKVIKAICEQLLASNPNEFKWRFNLTRNYIFIRGSIPRGKGRSPKTVTPIEIMTPTELLNELNEVEDILNRITGIPKNSFFKHPYFGELNLKRAIYFLRLHTAHHLKIIDEIEYSCIYSNEPVESELHA